MTDALTRKRCIASPAALARDDGGNDAPAVCGEIGKGLQSGSNGVGCAFNHTIANDDPLYKHQSNLNGSIFERRWKRIVNDLAEQVLLQKRMVGAPKADRKLFFTHGEHKSCRNDDICNQVGQRCSFYTKRKNSGKKIFAYEGNEQDHNRSEHRYAGVALCTIRCGANTEDRGKRQDKTADQQIDPRITENFPADISHQNGYDLRRKKHQDRTKRSCHQYRQNQAAARAVRGALMVFASVILKCDDTAAQCQAENERRCYIVDDERMGHACSCTITERGCQQRICNAHQGGNQLFEQNGKKPGKQFCVCKRTSCRWAQQSGKSGEHHMTPST